MAELKTVRDVASHVAEMAPASDGAMALAQAAVAAIEARDAAKRAMESAMAALRNRTTGYAMDEWLMNNTRTGPFKHDDTPRTEEELAEMAKLRTWWVESDGESRTAYYIFREPVNDEEGRRVLMLWGFDPDASGCHCAGDCCGHWFSNGVYTVNDTLWQQGWNRNV